MKFKAEIKVTLKDEIKDPQGLAVETVLKRIMKNTDSKIRVGKYFEIQIEADSTNEAQELITSICDDVLTNPCLEKYEIIKVENL